jgi:predicted nucleic acid-binding protein
MIVLADTSVWIDHFRSNNSRLGSLLSDGRILTHPFVLGELAAAI